MYTRYYGFREKPFALSPDPRFLYLSESHREVLGHLVYGIEQGEGFMAITGEVGTGKTTLCRTLLRRLGSESEVAFLFNPTLTPLELLKAINAEFELSVFGDSRPELTEVLNAHLLETRAQGRRVLLIVDEAQNLSTETLEQLRLLSNLETESSKLIQIVLLGQPELDAKLAADDLRQLRQRISVRCHLGPLDANETRAYVRHRLRVAGALERPIFTDRALSAVHQISGGVPRVINVVCDRALLAGYADQEAQIGRKLVVRAAAELRPRTAARFGRRAWLAAGGVAALLLGGSLVALSPLRSAERDPAPVAAAPRETPSPRPSARAQADEDASRIGVAPSAPRVAGSASAVDPDAERASETRALASIAAPAPEAPDPTVHAVLGSVLTLRSPPQTRAATLDAAFAAWRMPIGGATEIDFDELRERLASRRIELLPIAPEIPALRQTAAPAIVSLRDEHGTARSALLRGLSETHADLEGLVPRSTVRVSHSDLLRHMDGEVYALWRNYQELPPVLERGSRGAGVAWIQGALARLGHHALPPTGDFDADTERAVADFQSEHGIEADGVVGPRTQMQLYRALPHYATPTLASGPVDLAHAR